MNLIITTIQKLTIQTQKLEVEEYKYTIKEHH